MWQSFLNIFGGSSKQKKNKMPVSCGQQCIHVHAGNSLMLHVTPKYFETIDLSQHTNAASSTELRRVAMPLRLQESSVLVGFLIKNTPLVAVIFSDRSCILISVRTSKIIHRLEDVYRIESLGKTTLLAFGINNIRLICSRSLKTVRQAKTSLSALVQTVSINSNQDIAIGSYFDIHIFDKNLQMTKFKLSAHRMRIIEVKFISDTLLASIAEDSYLNLWDISDDKLTNVLSYSLEFRMPTKIIQSHEHSLILFNNTTAIFLELTTSERRSSMSSVQTSFNGGTFINVRSSASTKIASTLPLAMQKLLEKQVVTIKDLIICKNSPPPLIAVAFNETCELESCQITLIDSKNLSRPK